MLDRADVTLLTIILLVFVASSFYTYIVLKRDATRLQKYKLYKVRDDLIYLVAVGKLNKDDFVFESFYNASNHLVKAVEHINLASLVRAIKEARQRGLDPAAENKLQQIHRALQTKDREVINAVNGFYRAVTEILIENSLLLQVIVKCHPVARIVNELAGWTKSIKFRPIQRDAYRFYQDYSQAIQVAA